MKYWLIAVSLFISVVQAQEWELFDDFSTDPKLSKLWDVEGGSNVSHHAGNKEVIIKFEMIGEAAVDLELKDGAGVEGFRAVLYEFSVGTSEAYINAQSDGKKGIEVDFSFERLSDSRVEYFLDVYGYDDEKDTYKKIYESNGVVKSFDEEIDMGLFIKDGIAKCYVNKKQIIEKDLMKITGLSDYDINSSADLVFTDWQMEFGHAGGPGLVQSFLDKVYLSKVSETPDDILYNIKFDLGEFGSASAKKLDLSLKPGQKVKEPKIKTEFGYRFTGWDKEITLANADATYVAQYEDLAEHVRTLGIYEVNNSAAKIYDLNGTLQQVNSVITVDGKGKIKATYEESDGALFRVGSFKGKAKSSKTGLRVKLSYKEKNLIDGVKGKEAYKTTLILSGNNLVGEKKVGKEVSAVTYPLVNTDGSYSLDLSSLSMDEKGKYVGIAVLTLSNGKSFSLATKGAFRSKKSEVKIKLKGIKGQASSGMSFKLLINSDNAIQSIKAKALGQKVKFIK